MARLLRSDCSGPGIARRGRGRGFEYLDDQGRRVTDPEVLARIRELGIPPAWSDVWICPYPRGHLQATGTDAAGRKQYLYHDGLAHPARRREVRRRWTRFARALPAPARARARQDLEAASGYTRERVLACAVRLLDRGFFRIGSEEYTRVVRARHDAQGARDRRPGTARWSSTTRPRAASGASRPSSTRWRPRSSAALKRRRGGGDELLAYKDGRALARRALRRHQRLPQGRHRRRLLGQGLPHLERDRARRGRAVGLRPGRGLPDRRASARSRRAVKETAHYLGNTPAVCRASYIDPRVFDAYRAGLVLGRPLREAADAEPGELPTHHRAIEEAVLDLIDERERSPRRASSLGGLGCRSSAGGGTSGPSGCGGGGSSGGGASRGPASASAGTSRLRRGTAGVAGSAGTIGVVGLGRRGRDAP